MGPYVVFPAQLACGTDGFLGRWMRTTAVLGLAAGLSSTVLSTAVISAWSRWFDPAMHPYKMALPSADAPRS